MSMALAEVGLLVGNPIAGALLRSRSGWLGLQAWAGTLITVSMLDMMARRIARAGPALTAKA